MAPSLNVVEAEVAGSDRNTKGSFDMLQAVGGEFDGRGSRTVDVSTNNALEAWLEAIVARNQ